MGKDKKLEMDDLQPRARDVDDRQADEVTGGLASRGSAKTAAAKPARTTTSLGTSSSVAGQKPTGNILRGTPPLRPLNRP